MDVLIGGDSFGCIPSERKIETTTFTELLFPEANITCVAKAGSDIVTSSALAINELHSKNYDHLVFYVTEYYRKPIMETAQVWKPTDVRYCPDATLQHCTVETSKQTVRHTDEPRSPVFLADMLYYSTLSFLNNTCSYLDVPCLLIVWAVDDDKYMHYVTPDAEILYMYQHLDKPKDYLSLEESIGHLSQLDHKKLYESYMQKRNDNTE